MKKLIVYIYHKMPAKTRNKIGRNKWLKYFRDYFLRKDGVYREAQVHVNRNYHDYEVDFEFIASIKVASKGHHKGIENKMLNNSISLIKKRTQNNDCVVLDVGANFGYLSMVWAHSVCQNGKVIAFEPNADVNKTLKNTIAVNHLKETVILEKLAVGDEEKEIELYLNNTTSNVLKTEKSNALVKLQMTTLDRYVEKNSLNRCDLIKIDVDGIELDILKGSIDLLKRFQPIYIVETNDDMDIIKFFKQRDYNVLDAALNVYNEGDKLPLNVFCIPKNEMNAV